MELGDAVVTVIPVPCILLSLGEETQICTLKDVSDTKCVVLTRLQKSSFHEKQEETFLSAHFVLFLGSVG